MTDAQFIDYLFQERSEYKETPGFRLFMIGWMAAVSEEGLNAGEEAPMLHMAYTAGQHQAIARTWTDERPTEPGEYWVSIEPGKRGFNVPGRPTRPNRSVIPIVIEMDSVSYDPGLTAFFDRRGYGTNERSGWIGKLDSGFFDGAKWSRRETPADPFEVTK